MIVFANLFSAALVYSFSIRNHGEDTRNFTRWGRFFGAIPAVVVRCENKKCCPCEESNVMWLVWIG
ncbi:hypothetical protein NRI_0080 [Neorickettsia risticii str. Illinois]|uniref:Uncharacterized protein n=1 Tax=Neorickettsia risticii (strain Illinois) TaxID=434131 RepID=C6V3W2_NEORI|nr:hypothetical protein NRI_0080 [Neorickettsia risticii str. Illinois]